ncbi:MAG TPA: type II toxin-antitoxin system HicA family toxin [Rhodanobacteraceae bacterium]|nr:type II toxin-antitoxin system HicA family toxin [Rhodanobacteraceae bacterium]
MKLPRDVDGAALAQTLCRRFGYRIVHQVGSHMVLQRETPHHRVAIPNHRPLRLGTLNAILRTVEKTIGVERAAILAALD